MPVVPFKDPQSSKDSSARDVSDSWFDDESEGGKMSFLEHLDELRKRIIRALLSLSVGVAIAAFFLEDILNFVMRPLSATLPPGRELHLHLSDRSLHAADPDCAHRRAVHRDTAGFLAGLAVRGAGALRERAAVRDSLRGCCRRSASSAARPSRITWRSRSCGGSSRASRTR